MGDKGGRGCVYRMTLLWKHRLSLNLIVILFPPPQYDVVKIISRVRVTTDFIIGKELSRNLHLYYVLSLWLGDLLPHIL